MRAIELAGNTLTVPILQGGMGVGVSMGSLAGSVAANGAMGTISTALAGFNHEEFKTNPDKANNEALAQHVRMAKEIANGAGMVAINAMVATRQCAESVKTAVAAGVDAVVCGAGLALDLPNLVDNTKVAIAPIVSGGRAATLLCRTWLKRYSRLPDFIVVEGSKAGGHLGFAFDDIAGNSIPSIEALVKEVVEAVLPFEEKSGKKIAVFGAGGVFDGADIASVEKAGAVGAQLATRFIATQECDASQGYKDVIINAKEEDVALLHSPVGMPGRAVRTPLIEKLNSEIRVKPQRCVNCLTPCDPKSTPFCIASALVAAVKGDYENGLFFCGSNVGKVNSMTTVPELLSSLTNEWRLCR